jgi:hypothetical protein
MSTQRKRNRFLNAERDGNSYTLKPEAQSQHAAAYRRGAKAVEARCENCETALR